MAEQNWIKMRCDLWTDPRVVRIMSALKADRSRIIGALFRAWSIADAHTIDGNLPGYTPEVLDADIGIPGFSAELQGVGWLEVTSTGIAIPRFTEHNGQSAKRRAQDTARKGRVRKVSASKADKKRNRVEESRVEESRVEKKKPIHFVEPTLEQVTEYCQERGPRGQGIDPEQFIDFYASKGWKVGNQKMKDWRAAVRTWERNATLRGSSEAVDVVAEIRKRRDAK